MALKRLRVQVPLSPLKGMSEKAKHVDLIQAGLEDLAKLTGKPVEELARQSLEESEKLEQSEETDVKRSAREQALRTKIAVNKIKEKKP